MSRNYHRRLARSDAVIEALEENGSSPIVGDKEKATADHQQVTASHDTEEEGNPQKTPQ